MAVTLRRTRRSILETSARVTGLAATASLLDAGRLVALRAGWHAQYGGLQVDQAKRLKELEQENAKLKWLVAELSLDKLVSKDIASGNF